MKLSVPIFSQNDVKWKTKKINGTTSTMGDYGCYITALAMFLKFRGNAVTPGTLEDNLEKNLCFNADLLDANKAAQLYKGTFNGIEQFDTKPAPLDRIKALLDQGTPVIVEIDARPSVAGKQTHFVIIVGYNGNSIIINDPWDGTEAVLEQKYANSTPPSAASTITGLRIFSFPTVEDQAVNDELVRIVQFLKENNALSESKVREAFGALQEKPNYITEITNLKEKIKAMEDNQAQTVTQVNGLREKIEELSQLNAKIQELATDWQTKWSSANSELTKESQALAESEKNALELNKKIAELTTESSKEVTLSKFIDLVSEKIKSLFIKSK